MLCLGGRKSFGNQFAKCFRIQINRVKPQKYLQNNSLQWKVRELSQFPHSYNSNREILVKKNLKHSTSISH